MERLLSPFLGGEFSRHFWPGVLFGLLLVVALLLNGVSFEIDEKFLISVGILALPTAVLLGVLLDVVGHIFVLSPVARARALNELQMSGAVLSLMQVRLAGVLTEGEHRYNLETLSEYCFALPRAASTNQLAHQKYEEQFTYFEFNRSFCLFFAPLIVYLGLLMILNMLPVTNFAAGIIALVFLSIAQAAVLLMAWYTFHRPASQTWVARLGLRYFSPVFSVYKVVTTVQLGMLYDYFLRSDIPVPPATKGNEKSE